MSDLIKWALLAVCIISVIAMVVVFADQLGLTSVVNTVVQLIGTGLSAITPYLKTGRELLNNFFIPQCLTACLFITFLGWLFKLGVNLVSSVVRFIYK